MTRIGWTLRQRGGLPLVAAAGALSVALALDGLLAPRWRDETRDLLGQSQELQRDARDAEAQQARVPAPAHAAAGLLWPAEDRVSSRMADLLALALRHGVAVQRVQRVGGDADAAGAARTRLVMPVRAAYVDLRQFIAEALQQDEALALERVGLRRHKGDAAELEGDLQWVLFHRRAGAAAP